MTGLEVNTMSYPTLQGVSTVLREQDTWVGVGVDPEGTTHVLVRVDPRRGKHGSKPATWYSLQDYPQELRDVVEQLQEHL